MAPTFVLLNSLSLSLSLSLIASSFVLIYSVSLTLFSYLALMFLFSYIAPLPFAYVYSLSYIAPLPFAYVYSLSYIALCYLSDITLFSSFYIFLSLSYIVPSFLVLSYSHIIVCVCVYIYIYIYIYSFTYLYPCCYISFHCPSFHIASQYHLHVYFSLSLSLSLSFNTFDSLFFFQHIWRSLLLSHTSDYYSSLIHNTFFPEIVPLLNRRKCH